MSSCSLASHLLLTVGHATVVVVHVYHTPEWRQGAPWPHVVASPSWAGPMPRGPRQARPPALLCRAGCHCAAGPSRSASLVRAGPRYTFGPLAKWSYLILFNF
jgi:hypothetical protein